VGQVSKHSIRITFINGESITCTDNHPFYLYKWGLTYWEKASRIKPGDMFLIATVKQLTPLVFDYELYSSQGTVSRVDVIRSDEPKPYYDFTVDKYHNMLVRVGTNYVIAHNSSVYEALVGMVTSPLPLIDGQGDFGDQSSSAGAMRYTEARLSAFSDAMLLDKDYLAVTPMIPNYSGDKTVPVYLPAKLPMVLLLGNDGIAFGVAASSPSFTLESVVEITKKAIDLAARYDKLPASNKKNARLSSAVCASVLKFSFRYGGLCISDTSDIESFMRSGKGTLKFTPTPPKKISTPKQKRYVITSACPGFSTPATIEKTLQAIAAIKGVTLVSDTSDFSGCSYTVNLKVSLSQAEVDSIFKAIDKLMVKSDSYDVGLTHRGINATKFFTTNIPNLLLRWSLWRLDFEKKVIAYKYRKYQEQLKKLNLLILAVDNIDIIAQAIQSSDAKAYLMANLAITAEEADVIRDFKIRQLEKTDVHKVKAEIKDIRSTMAGLRADHAAPSNRVKADIDSFMSKHAAQQAKKTKKP
jgi:DNA gyrase subunit A